MAKIIRKHWSILAKIFFLVFFFVVLGFSSKFFYSDPLPAKSSWLATTTWIGTTATGNWQDSTKWSNGVPSSTALVVISSSSAITITATGTINFDTIQLGGGGGTASSTLVLVGNIGTGVDIDIKNNGKFVQSSTVQQTISGTLLVEAGGRLTHGANSSTQVSVINFNANTITVDAGGFVFANALGYVGGVTGNTNGRGPGGGIGSGTGGGGGHGGNGGDTSTNAGGQGYCDITNPNTMGSGGGKGGGASGGAGGGLIILTATGTITLNGIITANGTTGSGSSDGAGAGGGIKITADTISGTPSSFTALGATRTATGASGGGGCIFLGYITSNSISPTSSYFSVSGGLGTNIGSGGMVLVKQTGVNNGGLYVLNNDLTATVTKITSTLSNLTVDSIYVSSTVFQISSTQTFTLTNADPFFGNGTGEISVYGTLFKSGGFSTISNGVITLYAGGIMTAASNVNLGVSSTLNLTTSSILSGNVTNFNSSGTLHIYSAAIISSTINLAINANTTTLFSFTTSSPFSIASLTINSGGVLTHATNTTAQINVVNISASNNITINSGGRINVNGFGYAGGLTGNGNGQGPGGGKGGPVAVGGGHGGNGGNTTTISGLGYCDITNISTIGSGGGGGSAVDGGAGGGLIILSATGTVTVNGIITADGVQGENNDAAGGSGGGIKITADVIAGTPSNFSASGANAKTVQTSNGGSGGGGCVDIFYTTSNTITPTSSYFFINGGTTGVRGGGGIALVKQTGGNNGGLYVLNNGLAIVSSQVTSTLSNLTVDFIYVSSSIFLVSTTQTFTLDNSDPFFGNSLGGIRVYGSMLRSGGTFNSIHNVALTIESGGSVTVSSTFTASSTLNLYRGFIGIATDTFRNLILQSGTTTLYNYNTNTAPLSLTILTMNSSSALTSATNTADQVSIIYLAASSTITINHGATVSANGTGYSGSSAVNVSGNGPGGGGSSTTTSKGGGGGGHGGNGGAGTSGIGGISYCSSTNPSTIGSGGAGTSASNLGRPGGGLIWLSATGTITISGNIKANGDSSTGGGGAGSGGGIKLVAGTIAGTPQSFTANGGNNISTAGGGGGGCIFIQYTSSNSITASVATSTFGTSGTGTDGSAGTFQTLQTVTANNIPTVTAIFPVQTSTYFVIATTTITDADSNITSLSIFYSTNGSTWVSSTIGSVTGGGSITTSSGRISNIGTDSGAKNITFEWNVGVDLVNTEDSSVYIKIIPNDDIADGAEVSSTAFSVDTKAPTAPGNLVLFNTSTQSAVFTFGTASVETNFLQYIIFYKAGSSGVTITDSAFTSSSDSHLGFINYSGATSTLVTGLATSTQYVFNIWAYDSFSNTAAAAEVTFYSLAAVPSAPTLSNQTTTTIDVAVTSGDTNPITVEYAIQETSSTSYVQANGTLGASAVWATRSAWGTKTVRGLTANTAYTFKVKARNGDNVETAFSATSSLTSSANNVIGFAAVNSTVTSTYQITLSWTNAGQPGMKLERDNSCNGTYDITLFDNFAANDLSPTTTFSGLSANTCYRFRISSYNSAGVLNSTDVSISNDITTPPAAPTNLTASVIASTSITWTWDAVTGATTYYVYNTNSVLIDTVVAATSQQNSLTVSTTYSVFVRAANANGTGVSSSLATAVTGPAAPTGLQADSRTTSTITWSWTNGGQFEFYAQDKNNVGNNSGWITSTTWVQNNLATNTAYTLQVKARDAGSVESGFTEITRYTAQNNPTGFTFVSSTANSITAVIDGSFFNLGVGSSLIHIENGAGGTQDLTNTTTWQNTGLNPGTQYNFSASATNGDGIYTASTTGSKYTLAATPVAPTLLGLSASTLSIAITSAGDTNSAIVEYAMQETGSGNYVQSDGSLGVSAYWASTSTWGAKTVTGLSVNTQYIFKVKARNGENTETEFGPTASLYTFANVPGMPVLSSAATSSLAVTFDTASNPNYTTYAIHNDTAGNYGAADGSSTASPVWQASSTWTANYLAKGLSPNTAYQFSVIARNGDNVLTNTSTQSAAKYTLASDPSSVVATVDSQTQITLSWNRDATSSYAENITASTTSGWISGTSFVSSGLTCNTSYTFRVKAINEEGVETGWSSSISALTSACGVTETPAPVSGGAAYPITVTPPVVVQPIPPTQPKQEIVPPTAIATTTEKIPPQVLPLKPKPIVIISSSTIETAVKNPIIVPIKVVTLPVRILVGSVINGPQQITSISAPLPKDLLAFVEKFPQIHDLMSQMGVNKLNDIYKLKSVNISLPGLISIVGLKQSSELNVKYESLGTIPVVQIPGSLKDKIPSNIVFAQGAGQMIDFGAALSFNEKSNLEQKINVISGKSLQLTIKPDFPVKQIRGILTYIPSNEQVNAQSTGAVTAKSWLVVEPALAAEKVLSAPLEKKLVLLEFEYIDSDKDGIYTAKIQAPVPAGQYKILTIMDYQDPNRGSRQVELVAVVDPEGRVYENVGGQQLIVSGAKVTLFQFNSDKQKYEIWPAKDFLQTNPVTTDVKGIYSFLVPDGTYYIKVEAPGYLAYTGQPFVVAQGGGIHTDIELKPKYWGIKIMEWRTMLVVVFAVFMGYFIYKEKKLEKKEKKLEDLLEKK